MITNSNDLIFMIGLDGRVRRMPFYLKGDLLKQGWHIITNPKEEYYPNYDLTNSDGKQVIFANNGTPDGDILEVDIV